MKSEIFGQELMVWRQMKTVQKDLGTIQKRYSHARIDGFFSWSNNEGGIAVLCKEYTWAVTGMKISNKNSNKLRMLLNRNKSSLACITIMKQLTACLMKLIIMIITILIIISRRLLRCADAEQILCKQEPSLHLQDGQGKFLVLWGGGVQKIYRLLSQLALHIWVS